MGNLLKMKPTTIAEAKARLEKHIAESHQRYDRAVTEIKAMQPNGSSEPILGVRARNTIRRLVAFSTGKLNSWGRPEWDDDAPVTPEAVSRFSAEEILEVPNCGHKSLREIVVWLNYHGLKLSD